MNFLIKKTEKYGKIRKKHSIPLLTMYGNKFSKMKQNKAAKVKGIKSLFFPKYISRIF